MNAKVADSVSLRKPYLVHVVFKKRLILLQCSVLNRFEKRLILFKCSVLNRFEKRTFCLNVASYSILKSVLHV